MVVTTLLSGHVSLTELFSDSTEISMLINMHAFTEDDNKREQHRHVTPALHQRLPNLGPTKNQMPSFQSYKTIMNQITSPLSARRGVSRCHLRIAVSRLASSSAARKKRHASLTHVSLVIHKPAMTSHASCHARVK